MDQSKSGAAHYALSAMVLLIDQLKSSTAFAISAV